MNGTYTSAGKSKGTVQFLSTGEVTGLEGYDRFEVCTGGDCFVAGQESDVLILSNSKTKDAPKYAGFKFTPNRTALTLYELTPGSSDQKGTAQKGAVLYTFTRSAARK